MKLSIVLVLATLVFSNFAQATKLNVRVERDWDLNNELIFKDSKDFKLHRENETIRFSFRYTSKWEENPKASILLEGVLKFAFEPNVYAMMVKKSYYIGETLHKVLYVEPQIMVANERKLDLPWTHYHNERVYFNISE